VAALGDFSDLEYTIVMKRVMDHADSFKSDNFKTVAARASAECLVAFVRAHLPPRDRGRGQAHSSSREASRPSEVNESAAERGERVALARDANAWDYLVMKWTFGGAMLIVALLGWVAWRRTHDLVSAVLLGVVAAVLMLPAAAILLGA